MTNESSAEIQNIYCAVDFGLASLVAAGQAVQFANQLDAELTLMHVHTPPAPVHPPAGGIGSVVPSMWAMADDPSQSKEKLENMATQFEVPGRSVKTLLLSSRGKSVAETIANRTESDSADLLVLGSRGHRGFDRLLLGSVARGVLDLAACPVLVAPSPNTTTN